MRPSIRLSIALISTSLLVGEAFAFSELITGIARSAFGRSEFCGRLLENRISRFDPTRDKNCSEVSTSDAECSAKCKQISDENAAASEMRKNAAFERVARDGEYTSPGLSSKPDDAYCTNISNRPSVLSFDECKTAYNTGVARSNEKIAIAQQASKLKEEELSKQKAEAAKRTSDVNAFYESTEFLKLKYAITILTKQSRIELAEQEQQRQKEIGKQSGYIDKYQMNRLGSVVVDAKNQQKESFSRYKSLGGKATSIDEVRQKIGTCNFTMPTLQAMFILAETGQINAPSDEEMAEWKRSGHCI